MTHATKLIETVAGVIALDKITGRQREVIVDFWEGFSPKVRDIPITLWKAIDTPQQVKEFRVIGETHLKCAYLSHGISGGTLEMLMRNKTLADKLSGVGEDVKNHVVKVFAGSSWENVTLEKRADYVEALFGVVRSGYCTYKDGGDNNNRKDFKKYCLALFLYLSKN